MKISLIYIQTIEGNNVVPPLGLMYVAAVAKEAGHTVQLLDVDPDQIDVVKKVAKFSADLIGLSFLTTEFEKARLLSCKLRAAFPGVILCSGGVHTTVDTENVLRKFNLDFCVIGEGELTFLELCQRIERGECYDELKGIALLKKGEFVRNPPRELIKDLDSIPFPARELVDFANIYLTFPCVIRGKYIKSTVIMAGRGCYFNCAYCSVTKMFGRSCRMRSPTKVLREIVYLKDRYGIRGVYFMDSTLTANKRWILSFCEEVIRSGLKLIWSGNTRVDTVDTEMLRLMKKAGCVQLDYGVESGSPKILKMFNKNISPEKAISALKMSKDAGIRVSATFMIGNPGEELSDLEKTFNLAKKIKANYTIFFFTIPYPGTRLWEIARERNLIKNDLTYSNQWNLRTADTPLLADKIPKNELESYRAKFQNYFFFRNYISFDNIIIGFYLLFLIFRFPGITQKALRRVFRYKRWDSLIEEVLVAYRKSLYKYY